MMAATTTTKTRGDFDDHDDSNNDHKDNVNLIFDSTTNLWSDSFLQGRGW